MSEPNISPTRTTPITEPQTEPVRRMFPGKICPAQRTRVAEKIKRVIDP